jgi:hypothetical protein
MSEKKELNRDPRNKKSLVKQKTQWKVTPAD